jgi:hypothetical protein
MVPDFRNVLAIFDTVEGYIQPVKQYAAQAARFVGHMITDHPDEFITAIATCVIAAFTIVLARSTTRLWGAAKV